MKQRLEDYFSRFALQKLLRVLCVLPFAGALLYGGYVFGPTFNERSQNENAPSDDTGATTIPQVPNRKAPVPAVLGALRFAQLPIAGGCDGTTPEAFIGSREQEYRRQNYFSVADPNADIRHRAGMAGIFWKTVIDHHWFLGSIPFPGMHSKTVSPMLLTVAFATPSCRARWETIQYTPFTGARESALTTYHDPELPVPPQTRQLFGFEAVDGAALEEYKSAQSVVELQNWYRNSMAGAWHRENLSERFISDQSDSLIYFSQPGRYRIVALNANTGFGETTVLVVTGTP
jgi:hypothetical protein